jgi:hypothetical protein
VPEPLVIRRVPVHPHRTLPHHHDFTIILRGAPAYLSHCCDALTQTSTTVSLRILHDSPIHPRAVCRGLQREPTRFAPTRAPAGPLATTNNHHSSPNNIRAALPAPLHASKDRRFRSLDLSRFSLARLSLCALLLSTCSYAPPCERASLTTSLLATLFRSPLHHPTAQQSVRDTLRLV